MLARNRLVKGLKRAVPHMVKEVAERLHNPIVLVVEGVANDNPTIDKVKAAEDPVNAAADRNEKAVEPVNGPVFDTKPARSARGAIALELPIEEGVCEADEEVVGVHGHVHNVRVEDFVVDPLARAQAVQILPRECVGRSAVRNAELAR